MISPSFASVTCCVSFIFFGAFVQRLLAFGGQQRRSLAGKACALGGELQAGREAWNIPAAQIGHRPAEMTKHHAGAGADDDRHARDRSEGGEQAAPDAPSQPQKAKKPNQFANLESRHAVPVR